VLAFCAQRTARDLSPYPALGSRLRLVGTVEEGRRVVPETRRHHRRSVRVQSSRPAARAESRPRPSRAAAGWYLPEEGSRWLRWWDGEHWTDHVCSVRWLSSRWIGWLDLVFLIGGAMTGLYGAQAIWLTGAASDTGVVPHGTLLHLLAYGGLWLFVGGLVLMPALVAQCLSWTSGRRWLGDSRERLDSVRPQEPPWSSAGGRRPGRRWRNWPALVALTVLLVIFALLSALDRTVVVPFLESHHDSYNSSTQVNTPAVQTAVLAAVQLGVTSELQRGWYLSQTSASTDTAQ